MTKLKIGDKVAYSIQWLKSTGQSHSEIAHARGVITGLTELSKECVLANIEWGNDDYPKRVNVNNLAKVGLNRKFQNID